MPSTRHLQNSRGVDERYAVAACSSLHYEGFMISDKGGYDFALSCLSVSRIIWNVTNFYKMFQKHEMYN